MKDIDKRIVDNFNIIITEKQLELIKLKNEKHKFYETLFSVGEVVLVKKSNINEIHLIKKNIKQGLWKYVEKDEEMVIMEIDTRIPGKETISFGNYCKETNTSKDNSKYEKEIQLLGMKLPKLKAKAQSTIDKIKNK